MKKAFLLLIIAWYVPVNAQTLDYSVSIGTGKTYIVEDWYNSVNVNYGLPLSLVSEIIYSPVDSKWRCKLRLHSLESGCTGVNWVDGNQLDGYINSLTSSFLLEKATIKGSYSHGLSFGLGWTRETIQPLQTMPSEKDISRFPSIIIGEHFTWKLSDSFDFQLLPTILWQDPFKSIGYLTSRRSANFAGEDLSFTMNVGIKYHIIK